MPNRTKLYQRAGSPLIQGRSKHERPVFQSLLTGAAIAFVVWVAMVAADIAGQLRIFVSDPAFELIDLLPGPVVALALAALVGGYLGSVLADGMGWHRVWRPVFVAAFVADLIVALVVL